MIRRNISLIFIFCLVTASYAIAEEKIESTENQQEHNVTHQTSPDDHSSTDEHNNTHSSTVEKHKKQHAQHHTTDTDNAGSTTTDYPDESHHSHGADASLTDHGHAQ